MDGGGAGKVGRSSIRSVLPRYKLGRTLGIGTFGKVKVAVHTLTGTKVAIKILDRRSFYNSEAEKVRKEINIMRQLFHPHIVRLFEVIDTPSKVYVVMEYINCGELYYYLIEKGRLHEDEARHLFQQIISGVEYCHRRMVVHRDLKPENLILDSEHNIKITDFGLGNVMRDGHFLQTNCGTPNYAAPELICRQLYAGPEVDVWSCGVILYALLCGRLPFDDDNLPGLFAKIKTGVYPVASHLSDSAQDLISKMLVVDPMKRISIPEIRQHPWFVKQLPRYIAYPSSDSLHRMETVDMDTVKEVLRMGFNIREIIGSLQNHMQNEVTVAYNILLHNRTTLEDSRQNSKSREILGTENIQTCSQSVSSGLNNWTLGLKSQATPVKTMLLVMGIFDRMNVKWKRIGNYNMKCLWLPPQYSRFTLSSSRGICIKSDDAVKFEIQLYKASPELYVLDMQQLKGPPFLFLEVCAAFRALML